jgi:hypothetical protein
MRRLSPLYLLYGLAVVGALAAAEWRGLGLWTGSEARGVPRSVRDNPGSYRSTYVGGPRYYRGK